MIHPRSMNAAKRSCEGSCPERAPYFTEAQRSPVWWIFRNGKWRPRKSFHKQTEETKAKISESMKGNHNRRNRNENQEENQ